MDILSLPRFSSCKNVLITCPSASETFETYLETEEYDMLRLPVGLFKRILISSLLSQQPSNKTTEELLFTHDILINSTKNKAKGFQKPLYHVFQVHVYLLSLANGIQRVKLNVPSGKVEIQMKRSNFDKEANLEHLKNESKYVLCLAETDKEKIWMTEEDRILRYYLDPGNKLKQTFDRIELELVPVKEMPAVEIQVEITGNKRVRNLAERIYTMYTISVTLGSLHWVISRRYNEFADLHQKVYEYLPGINLPSIPSKAWWNNMDPAFIQQRQISLNEYLHRILSISDVKDCVPMLSFLGALSTTWQDHSVKAGKEREVVHLSVLPQFVSMGDVLLFRCRDGLSKLQRSVTGSEWDHIAMIVGTPESRNYLLFEATGSGVSLCPLVPRINAYASCFTRYIALRKLRLPISGRRKMYRKLLAFVNSVKGKPYGLGLRKFIGTRSTSETHEDFFCSELIAAALKCMGVIEQESAARTFWPGCFAMGGQIDEELANHGSSLDDVILIDTRNLELDDAQSSTHSLSDSK